MSSENMGLVPSQRLENGLGSQHHNHHHIVFQNNDALRFSCGAPAATTQHRVGGDSAGVPKTRDLSGFIDERFFAVPQAAAPADFRRGIYGGERSDPTEQRNWSGRAAEATPSVDGSDEDEEEDDDDDEEDDDADDDDVVIDNNGNNASNGGDKIGNVKQKRHSNDHHHQQQHHFGVNVMVGSSSRDLVVKESGSAAGVVAVVATASPQQPGSYSNINNNQNVVTVAENDGGGGGERYYSHFFQGVEGSSSAAAAGQQKDLGVENGCGFSGRRDGCSYTNESGESLRAILSDPVTGALMDDAMILPCGHSFGGGGIQHVIRMKSCFTCSQSVSEDSAAPNLSLRAAVQAFRREEELQFQRSAKRKRERFDQDKGVYGDLALMELPRGRGVQFPFAVTDRVVIKGNKRTPQRFVGREAIVTTQCLNGWYVVKTLDNAESVKLQYRSLAKVPDDPMAKPISSKMAPNWL